jgi:hypothetical protein
LTKPVKTDIFMFRLAFGKLEGRHDIIFYQEEF